GLLDPLLALDPEPEARPVLAGLQAGHQVGVVAGVEQRRLVVAADVVLAQHGELAEQPHADAGVPAVLELHLDAVRVRVVPVAGERRRERAGGDPLDEVALPPRVDLVPLVEPGEVPDERRRDVVVAVGAHLEAGHAAADDVDLRCVHQVAPDWPFVPTATGSSSCSGSVSGAGGGVGDGLVSSGGRSAGSPAPMRLAISRASSALSTTPTAR